MIAQLALIILAGGAVPLKTVLPESVTPVAMVCQVKGGMQVKWNVSTMAAIPANCRVLSRSITLSDTKSAGIKTSLETQLETLCSPCKPTPGQWGICPYCLLLEGGCAKACPITTDPNVVP